MIFTRQVLSKTLDMTKLSPEKIEIATLTRENNKTNIQILPAPRVRLQEFIPLHVVTFIAVVTGTVPSVQTLYSTGTRFEKILIKNLPVIASC
jgi:hypothetical protein